MENQRVIDFLPKYIFFPLLCTRIPLLLGFWFRFFLRVAQKVKNLPAMEETLVRSLGREDTLQKGMASHSNILGLLWWLRQLRGCLQHRRSGFVPWVGNIP